MQKCLRIFIYVPFLINKAGQTQALRSVFSNFRVLSLAPLSSIFHSSPRGWGRDEVPHLPRGPSLMPPFVCVCLCFLIEQIYASAAPPLLSSPWVPLLPRAAHTRAHTHTRPRALAHAGARSAPGDGAGGCKGRAAGLLQSFDMKVIIFRWLLRGLGFLPKGLLYITDF